MTFEQAFALARFYYDFQDTNALIANAEAMAWDNPAGLRKIAISIKASHLNALAARHDSIAGSILNDLDHMEKGGRQMSGSLLLETAKWRDVVEL